MSRLIKITLVCMGLFLRPAWAGNVLVAVASNFAAPMQKIAVAFEKDTGHQTVISFGSTGKLATQIRNGAPFDVLLAADDKTPAMLVSEGLALESGRFTYAMGQLVLWSPQSGLVDAHGTVLQQPFSGKLAVADPKLAPYGAAAFEVMGKKGVIERLRPVFVTGENIGRTFQFVKTGSAALGFVALSQVMVDRKISSGSAWVIPSNLYSPIRQDAVLLKNGQSNAAAQALLQYLRGDAARALIRAYGYQF